MNIVKAQGGIEWVRHIIDYGSRMGAGLQVRVADIDGDGDLDVIAGGKSGLFIAENMAKSPKTACSEETTAVKLTSNC